MSPKKILILTFLLTLSVFSILEAQENASKGYVNARELADSLGISYRWFPMQKMVILAKGTKMMRLVLEQKGAVVDNQTIALPTPPKLENGEVVVPARSIIQVFGEATEKTESDQSEKKVEKVKKAEVVEPPPQKKPPVKEETDEPDEDTTPQYTPKILKTEEPSPAQSTSLPKILTPPAESDEDSEEKPTLLAVRHSKRDDQTRVVLEFSGKVDYRTEDLGNGKMKVRFDGCRNIIPTKRSNPTGREIKAINFNSGADKKGLVVTVDRTKGTQNPSIETVGNPFRVILTFPANPEAVAEAKAKAASQTEALAASQSAVLSASQTASIKTPKKKNASETQKLAEIKKTASETEKVEKTPPKAVAQPILETPPADHEWKKDVEIEKLTRTVFQGRTVIIDAGHGGRDPGAHLIAPDKKSDLNDEKDITLIIAKKLKNALSQSGFTPILLRADDREISSAHRQSFVNSAMADLYVSLHLGAALDENVEGCACYFFAPTGFSLESDAQNRFPSNQIFNEWAQNYRFDLSRFLAGKISERMVKHLESADRGFSAMPLLPLRMITIPGVVVEIGMASNAREAGLLRNQSYQESAARAISNGITDFFNSLKLNN
ncbi:MAG: N-acetylmuramoyl-L-alanine amidase [Candidatus Riflebacteria bacterium]|nr:N-acetylmuramoyl-L-alanine amidase [Candidatus Riflebacteria bacterium]